MLARWLVWIGLHLIGAEWSGVEWGKVDTHAKDVSFQGHARGLVCRMKAKQAMCIRDRTMFVRVQQVGIQLQITHL